MIVEINELFKRLKEQVAPLKTTEIVPLSIGLGRVLARDFVASFDAPPYDNSALDGYAYKASDKDKPLRVVRTIFAGDECEMRLQDGECVKLMTGSKLPENADSVLRVEHSQLDENGFLLIPPQTPDFDGVKRRGEDIKQGEVLLKASSLITAGSVATLASQGVSFVEVFARPKVAVFSSGNEVVEAWEPRGESSIYNSNSSAICALLRPLCTLSYAGIIRDEKAELKRRFSEALSQNDAIVCSGGASVGEADFMDEVMSELGFERLVRGLNLRPGGPTKIYKSKFGFDNLTKSEKYAFVLPGNPMSAFVAAFLGVTTALKLLGGGVEVTPKCVFAKLGEDLKLRGKRNDTLCGRLVEGEFFTDFGDIYSPAMTKPLANLNAFCFTKKGDLGGKKGDFVKVYLV